jgi:hypothetical protein
MADRSHRRWAAGKRAADSSDVITGVSGVKPISMGSLDGERKQYLTEHGLCKYLELSDIDPDMIERCCRLPIVKLIGGTFEGQIQQNALRKYLVGEVLPVVDFLPFFTMLEFVHDPSKVGSEWLNTILSVLLVAMFDWDDLQCAWIIHIFYDGITEHMSKSRSGATTMMWAKEYLS